MAIEVNDMKKPIAFLLALMLPVCSYAESLRNQLGAPEQVQAAFYSSTGKSEVLVDAVVYVPDTERISTYDVSGRDASAQDARQLATASAPGTDWLTDWVRVGRDNTSWAGAREAYQESRNADNVFRSVEYCWYPSGGTAWDKDAYAYTSALNWAIQTAFGPRRVITRTEYRYNRGYNVPYFECGYETSTMDVTAPRKAGRLKDQPLTWDEATAWANRFAAQVSPAFILLHSGAVSGQITYHKAGTDTYRSTTAPRQAYGFIFMRVVEGVPVNYAVTSRSGNVPEKQHYTSPPQLEQLACIIDQDRIVSSWLDNPWTVGGVLREDVPLMPFSQIMEVFGAICPLTIQSMEHDAHVRASGVNRWEIREIRLGYMPVLRRDNSGAWELRPVWDFIGVRAFASEYYDEPGNCALTIDAIDGTVIDRAYGY